ncbi:DUF5666 domain-containing protein [Patescibacteria group bacterium]|nr:DUF5666 domain-containing protein [Patescibacteria group bacterium]
MKKFIAVLAVTLILLVLVLTQARAETGSKNNKNLSPKETQSVSVTPTPETKTIETRSIGKEILQIIVRGVGKDHPKWKGFEMKGSISNVSPTSFDLNGKNIKMDATTTGKLQIKGTLVNDAFVKVEGKLIDGIYYAKDIKVQQNKGGEENENESEIDDENDSPTVTPTASLTPTPSVAPTGTVEKHGNQIKVTISGTLEEIIKALEDLLNTLKSQVSST